MTLTLLKAAELNEINAKENTQKMPEDLKEAILLGADALRRIDYHRKAGHFFAQQLLPTEISGPET